jgi:nuclear cap-binding protein subunit 2
MSLSVPHIRLTLSVCFQNKKRKYDRDGDDREGRERTPEEPAEDPLKDATTLYVGNL